jgi:large subunit ribosomal protein L24
VERVNFTRKHTKANPQKNIKGGILERESPIRMTNLQVICPSCGERTRVGQHVSDEGSNRVCKKCHAELGG